jgi:hypothetical protein
LETTENPVVADAPPSHIHSVLKWLFCIWVVALAIYQFSENTADPDLWGHALFGQEYFHSKVLAKIEPYSWTAAGQPWINHEVLAEIALGGAHQWMGGTGILLLKLIIGLVTFVIALRVGAEKMTWPVRAFAWAFAAVALVEISFGFAPRPQIFTALALAIELWILRKIHNGSLWAALGLPVLFALWINTHGGVLAGMGLLGLAAIGSTIQLITGKTRPSTLSLKTIVVLWLSVVAAGAALVINPWGFELVKWLIGSVLWLRPEIDEWNPTPLDWDHAALFALIGLSVFSWIYSRRQKTIWELLACAAFALLACRSVRNTPLFAIIALATVPQHLADACLRFRHLIAHREEKWRQPQFQTALANFFWISAVGILAAAFLMGKDHPLTIDVPKKQYPVSAIEFIKEHEIRGNLFVFFDWGEMCLWELPDSPVSVDGRLDTCYSREIITNHWQVYNAQPYDTNTLNLAKADFALLPSYLKGAFDLAKQPGWSPAYVDDTAVVLVRDAARFPLLAKETLPLIANKKASQGRAPFPEESSSRLARTKLP